MVRVLCEPVPDTASEFNPTITRRRPVTSYVTSYKSFAASPRIKSAKYPSAGTVTTMPRSHVSIARFYDWSEDLGECVSISNFYRDLAGSQKFEKVRGKVNKWALSGTHPGRMFLRDKAGLTKGEREIIEGICKNRGDVSREDSNSQGHPKDEWDFVRSHRDAWNVRKQIMNHRSILPTDSSPELKLPDEIFSRVQVNGLHSPKDHCVFCDVGNKEIDLRICVHKREEAPKAPPTTPDRLSSSDDEGTSSPRLITWSRLSKDSSIDSRGHESRLKVLRRIDSFGSHNGFTKSNDSNDSTRDRKKVFVNVFLPRIPVDPSRDHTMTSLAIDSRRSSVIDEKSNVREGMRFSKAMKNENTLSTTIQKTDHRVNSER
ncbi:hypothetical protein FSP39_008248 [Pinctada imbricata]|uniref:Uncharacterized protein n=1 Tax=Pinctada imbricata TaxID=66713 RepID=A0AA89BWS2_PINIB|nr:hypothetical protein FSP39_008248 [Pinctada imbricata]